MSGAQQKRQRNSAIALEAAVARVPHPCLLLDKHRAILYANPAADRYAAGLAEGTAGRWNGSDAVEYEQDGFAVSLYPAGNDCCFLQCRPLAATQHPVLQRAVFHQAAVGIAAAEIGGAFFYVNDYFCILTGRPREQLNAAGLESLTVSGDRPALEVQLGRLMIPGDSCTMDNRIERPDGTTVAVRTSLTLLPLGDVPKRRILAVMQEIDNVQHLRVQNALRRSNDDLEQFGYAASHDLQEPLRMVRAYAQLLAKRHDKPGDADHAECIHYITDGIVRMERLLDDLRTYWRVGGEIDDQPATSIDCNAVLRIAIENLRTAIHESEARIESSQLPSITGYAGPLALVFQNLIANAITYRSAAAPLIAISSEDAGSHWMVCIKDNGIGIKFQYLQRIFGIFKRLHGFDMPGTGIGLALCHRIVDLHGGRIWAESEYGRGSSFKFTLPK